MAKKKQPRGRPPKADKLEGNLNFGCPVELVERVTVYQKRIGFLKRADACRRLVEKGLEAEGG